MGNVFKKMKQCMGNINFKSDCMSSCCSENVDVDIEIDLNNDHKPDLFIGIHDGSIELKGIDTKAE